MLKREEKFRILKFIRSCYRFGVFPTVVDRPSWQLYLRSTAGRTRWAERAYFGSFILHCVYKMATLVITGFNNTSTPLHQLIIHAMLALCAPAVIFWYYELFIKNPGAFGIFFHMTMTGNIGGTMLTGNARQKGDLVSRLKEYTLQDLIAINLPYMVAPVFVAFMGLYTYYPTLGPLLHAGLPEWLQGWSLFAVLLLEEMRYLLILWAVAIPMFILQIIAFDLVSNQLKSLIDTIKRTKNREKLQRTYIYLRRIQLYVIIINVVNQYLIFSWKVVCIGCSIGTGYAAIAHFSDYPIFGVMYYLILIDGTFIYIVSYDKAFQIPELFKGAATLGLLRLSQSGCGDMRILKRQMRAIPQVGVKVGEFHVLERHSTPAFVYFVLSNTVSMLVAYNH